MHMIIHLLHCKILHDISSDRKRIYLKLTNLRGKKKYYLVYCVFNKQGLAHGGQFCK